MDGLNARLATVEKRAKRGLALLAGFLNPKDFWFIIF